MGNINMKQLVIQEILRLNNELKDQQNFSEESLNELSDEKLIETLLDTQSEVTMDVYYSG